MGSVGVDWIMYNPNYEYALHCAVEFDYGSNGSFNTIIKVVIVQRTFPLHMAIISCLYLAYVIYYLFITVMRIRDNWIQINDQKLEQEFAKDEKAFEIRRQEKLQRTKYEKALNFIGIE